MSTIKLGKMGGSFGNESRLVMVAGKITALANLWEINEKKIGQPWKWGLVHHILGPRWSVSADILDKADCPVTYPSVATAEHWACLVCWMIF